MKLSKVREFFDYLESEVGPDANVIIADVDLGYEYLSVEHVTIVEPTSDYEKETYGEKYVKIGREFDHVG